MPALRPACLFGAPRAPRAASRGGSGDGGHFHDTLASRPSGVGRKGLSPKWARKCVLACPIKSPFFYGIRLCMASILRYCPPTSEFRRLEEVRNNNNWNG